MTPLAELRPGQQIQTPEGPVAVYAVHRFFGDHYTLTLEGGSAMVPLPGSTCFEVIGAQLYVHPQED